MTRASPPHRTSAVSGGTEYLMQRFHCDWCEAQVPERNNLDSWSFILRHQGNGLGHVDIEICIACSTSVGLRRKDDGKSSATLGIAVLRTMVARLCECVKSPQRPHLSKGGDER